MSYYTVHLPHIYFSCSGLIRVPTVVASTGGSKPTLLSLFRSATNNTDDIHAKINQYKQQRQEEIRMSKLDRYFGGYG